MSAQTASGEAAFDYVIVGAGSAGCVLAEGLSRDGRSQVLAIEAGGTDRRFFVQMPLGYGKTFFDRSINWNYRAEPDPGLNGGSDFWPRGKIVGGSGSINAMVWIRGDARDYDDWAQEGNPGWSHRDLLPYFKAIEHNEAGADEWRGQGGPVHITDVRRQCHPLVQRFIDAGRTAGFPLNPDFNGATQEGIGTYQINTQKGWRNSSAKAFLRPALSRANLSLMTRTMVTRIVFEGSRAVGVEIERRGKREIIRARKEVILSAGAVNSPQLLQVSGVGQASHLKGLGIDVVHDAPAVGHHMQDHVGINYLYRSTIPTLNGVLRPWWGKLRAGLEFMLLSSGPLSLSLNQGGGFVRTGPTVERPNIQLYLQALTTTTAKTGTRPLLEPDPFPGFALGLSNCRPKARGTCLIRSADPNQAPEIRPNVFGHPDDLAEALEGVRILRKLAAQPSLASIIAQELAPGPEVVSDEAMIEDLRKRSGTVYHPCGTCRMGPDPATSVVDSRLRAHGLLGLRIVDASIFPSVISGNTNAPVMMTAAKGAAMILEDR